MNPAFTLIFIPLSSWPYDHLITTLWHVFPRTFHQNSAECGDTHYRRHENTGKAKEVSCPKSAVLRRIHGVEPERSLEAGETKLWQASMRTLIKRGLGVVFETRISWGIHPTNLGR